VIVDHRAIALDLLEEGQELLVAVALAGLWRIKGWPSLCQDAALIAGG
jgi:hypothetical protein